MTRLVRTFAISDLHFGYNSFYTYSERFGHILRPEFSCSNEADINIINNINELVLPTDKLYILGDLARTEVDLEKLSEINCNNLFLVLGNHDARFSMEELQKYFKEIYGFIYLKKKKYCLSHCPVHPSELRGMINVHGHVHRSTIKDRRYVNASVEVNSYKPILL